VTTDQPDAQSIRRHIAHARRVVVKVGSSSLASASTGLDLDRLRLLVGAVADRQARGSEMILVSSGAIAAGLEPLGLSHRPSDVPQQQAAAAVGQGLLMSAYTQAFASHGLQVAQVLLTKQDLTKAKSYHAALMTFGALTRMGVVPVVNENDTVATREIRYGDNDRLAALVAELVRADALVLLSDVDGLYTARPDDPSAERIDYVSDVNTLSVDVCRPGSSGVGSGGMATKIEAARLAGEAGIPVGLARWNQAATILAGDEVGTVFAAAPKRRSRRLSWLSHASTTGGQLFIDAGAARALLTTAASLLAAGVRRCSGDFHIGDSVDVIGPDGHVIARGIVAFDAEALPAMMGRTSSDLATVLGPDYARPIIHRDDLVMSPTAAR
jgi:glutamate 5-kinase